MSDDVLVTETTNTEPGAQTNAPETNINDLIKEIKDLRKESGNYRTKNKEISEQLNTLQTQLNEKDAQLSSFAAAAKENKIKSEFTNVAKESGIVDVEIALKLIDINLIELDDQSNPKIETITAQIETLKAAHPILFGEIKATIPKIDAASKGKVAITSLDDWFRQSRQ